MSFNAFNRSPPNLCCKHVPTDSLKELIAPNNLTIWLWRSIPTRLLALRRLGPIQTPAMLLWCRERERGGEACQEAEKRREWQRPPSAPCLSCRRPRTPAETLHLYDPTADHWLECYWEREDGENEEGSKWERKKDRKNGVGPYFSYQLSCTFAYHSTVKCSTNFWIYREKQVCFPKLVLRLNRSREKCTFTNIMMLTTCAAGHIIYSLYVNLIYILAVLFFFYFRSDSTPFISTLQGVWTFAFDRWVSEL